MKLLTLIYLIFVFHLPVWKTGYLNYKYRYTDDMPNWMIKAINIRNAYENKYCPDNFYWFNFSIFYIRKDYSIPSFEDFYYDEKHLFVIKKR